MFACLYVPDFPVQAALRCEPEERRKDVQQSPVIIVDGPASLLRVVAVNPQARRMGIAIGMTKLQAEHCGPVVSIKRIPRNEDAAQAALLDCAHAFSPRVESTAPGMVILDLEGTEKLFGYPKLAASRIAQQSRDFGFNLNVAVASNPDTALCAARGWNGITVIATGEERQQLTDLPLDVLAASPEILETLDGWGIHNLGALAQLPAVPLVERLGQEGLQLQKLARGEAKRTLVVTEPTENFIDNFEFDDPVETLEFLTFILNRLLQQLCLRLRSRSLATSELRLRLELETPQLGTTTGKEIYERVWKLPVPIADARVLVRLIGLDLHSISFSAPIKKLTIHAVPAKPRFSQHGLFAPSSPQAEQLEITLARIRGNVGNADENGIACVGSARVLDTHRPDSFAVQSFSVEPAESELQSPVDLIIAFRMFRPVLETSVELLGERPQSVLLGRRTLRVLAASGPWSSSGQWWKASSAWARDEWDVALKTTDEVGFYRIYRDRIRKQWFVEGMFD